MNYENVNSKHNAIVKNVQRLIFQQNGLAKILFESKKKGKQKQSALSLHQNLVSEKRFA